MLSRLRRKRKRDWSRRFQWTRWRRCIAEKHQSTSTSHSSLKNRISHIGERRKEEDLTKEAEAEAVDIATIENTTQITEMTRDRPAEEDTDVVTGVAHPAIEDTLEDTKAEEATKEEVDTETKEGDTTRANTEDTEEEEGDTMREDTADEEAIPTEDIGDAEDIITGEDIMKGGKDAKKIRRNTEITNDRGQVPPTGEATEEEEGIKADEEDTKAEVVTSMEMQKKDGDNPVTEAAPQVGVIGAEAEVPEDPGEAMGTEPVAAVEEENGEDQRRSVGKKAELEIRRQPHRRGKRATIAVSNTGKEEELGTTMREHSGFARRLHHKDRTFIWIC
eukprot:GHVU01026649.1.p2 GENE.GHVU01026649.1~~GHVU01026649.1.p2  ORF type:complete len:333 (+),score=88.78 GHVU01026649.1:108-1106(+)